MKPSRRHACMLPATWNSVTSKKTFRPTRGVRRWLWPAVMSENIEKYCLYTTEWNEYLISYALLQFLPNSSILVFQNLGGATAPLAPPLATRLYVTRKVQVMSSSLTGSCEFFQLQPATLNSRRCYPSDSVRVRLIIWCSIYPKSGLISFVITAPLPCLFVSEQNYC